MRWVIAPCAAAGLWAALALGACSDVRPQPDGGTTTVSVHPAGILDSKSEDFHVRELVRRNWNFSVCAGCHARMEPYGFALENYAGNGAWRSQENTEWRIIWGMSTLSRAFNSGSRW